MALIIKLLGAGQASPGSTTTAYTVPTTGGVLGALVNNVRLVNRDYVATCNVFYRPSGGSQIMILDKNKARAR